jgi:hypothetical protein
MMAKKERSDKDKEKVKTKKRTAQVLDSAGKDEANEQSASQNGNHAPGKEQQEIGQWCFRRRSFPWRLLSRDRCG